MTMRLVYKLFLAAASGALVFVSFPYADEGRLGWLLAWVVAYGWTGALFAVTILWPYLDRNNRPMIRGMGLVAASVLSFWCANWTVNHFPGNGSWGMPNTANFIASSIVGAAIVFIAAKFFVPFRWSKKYVSLGLGVAVLGGWLFDVLVNAIPENDYGLMAGFIAWHCLMCTSLHFSTLPDRKMVGAHAAN